MDSESKRKTVDRYLRAQDKLVSREEQQARVMRSKQRKAGLGKRKRSSRDWEDDEEEFEAIRKRPSTDAPAASRAPGSEPHHPWIVVGTGPRFVTVSKGGRPRHAHLGGHALPQGRPIVGDRALLDELHGGEARVRSIATRTSVLQRGAPGSEHKVKPIAANVDVAMLVATAGPKGLRKALLDRLRIAVEQGGIEPIVVLSKWDQVESDQRLLIESQLEELRAANIPALAVSAYDDTGLDQLHEYLAERCAVALGPSGAGKSTLLNRLDPEHERRTGDVRESDNRGRHTTTASSMHPFGRGGWLIDTPGIREFALVGVDAATVLESFPQLTELATQCPRGCTHIGAPGCAVAEGSAADPQLAQQYASFAKLAQES